MIPHAFCVTDSLSLYLFDISKLTSVLSQTIIRARKGYPCHFLTAGASTEFSLRMWRKGRDNRWNLEALRRHHGRMQLGWIGRGFWFGHCVVRTGWKRGWELERDDWKTDRSSRPIFWIFGVPVLESRAVEPSRVDYISVSCIYGFYTTRICISNYINNVHFIEYSSIPRRARLHSQHPVSVGSVIHPRFSSWLALFNFCSISGDRGKLGSTWIYGGLFWTCWRPWQNQTLDIGSIRPQNFYGSCVGRPASLISSPRCIF